MASNDVFDEIYEWIDTMAFSRTKKKISRDFSDAVLMAELLKKYYPSYVQLHNYNTGSSISKKVENWHLLNCKVLGKLGLKLGNDTIDKLARSETGVIENLLMSLRSKIMKDSDNERLCINETGQGETTKSILKASEELVKLTVSKQAYTRLKKSLQEKNDTVRSLKEKITHLENLINLKNQRIEDLETRCKQFTET